MRRSTLWIGVLFCLCSGRGALAETRISQNLFLGNQGLIAQGPDGAVRAFSFDAGANLFFGNQSVPDSSPIVDQILGFYCRTLGRTLASSLRFRFFSRAISLRLNQVGAQNCLRAAENAINNSPPSPAKQLFQNILAAGRPVVVNGQVLQPDFGAQSGVPQGGGGGQGQGVPVPGGGVGPLPPGSPGANAGDITPGNGGSGGTSGHAQPGDVDAPRPSGPQTPERPEAPGDRQLFCTDPQKAICDEAARQFNRPELNPTVNRRVLFEQLRNSAGNVQPAELGDGSANRNAKWMSVLDAMRRSFGPREVQLNNSIGTWKSRVIARISNAGLPPQTVREMTDKIQAIQIFNMIDLVKQGRVSLDDFLSYCGSDGLATGGFNSRNLIAMCPAHYSSLQETEGFERTLLHELGHSIDGDIFPAAHQKFEDCIKSDALRDFRSELGKEPDERQAELNAAETASQSVRGKSPQEALSTIARFVGRYCPNVGGGAAALPPTDAVKRRTDQVFTPGGEARHFGTNLMLKVLWGRNPDMRQIMGCPRASQNLPMCSMQGRVN